MGRVDFAKLGHFDKSFFKNAIRKGAIEKI